MEDINVFHVEDNEIDTMALERSISRLDVPYNLISADNGEKALKVLQDKDLGKFVILLDLNMPLMNGLEFLAKIRDTKEYKKATVFVLTTSDNPSDIEKAYEYNVAGYFIKSIDSESLDELSVMLKSYFKLGKLPESLH